jgi:uncharacterized protein YjbI with pentapeptide repeats
MRRCLAVLIVLLAGVGTRAQSTCPNPNPNGPNFSGQNLTDRNFSQQDLTNANFSGATLDGAQFIGAKLTGANFSKASLNASAKAPANFLNADLTRACFQESKLQRANLQFATVTCADFSSSDLTAAFFGPLPAIDRSQPCRAKFVHTTMKISQFPTSLWGYTDFTNTNFVDLTPASFSFNGVDITNAILVGVKLGGFDLRKSTLTGVDFTTADLRGAKMDEATAFGVKMINAKLSFASAVKTKFFNPANPSVQSNFQGATAVNSDFSEAILTSADLRGANFTGTKFTGAQLDQATLEAGNNLNATQVLAADFSNANFANAHLNGVVFQNTRLVKATITGTFLNTDFSRALLTGAVFNPKTTLQGVSFVGSSLQNADFRNAVLQQSPTSSGVNFSCAQLAGANFSSSTVTSASFNAAVMPSASDCCRQIDQTYFCGIDSLTQFAYGPTSIPTLSGPVTCPNGDQAQCKDDQWKVPNWTSTACNSQGVPQKVWIPPDCGGSPGPTVHIPDPKFLECLQIAFFGSAQGQQITTAFAATVPEISCPARGILDTTGLQAFTSLKKLDLTGNQLTDGTVFSKLPRLQVLKISGNQLATLSLSTLSDLSYLDASHNKIAGSITGWVAPNNLQYLDLSFNQLTGSTTNIQIQSSLFYADLSHNKLTDVGRLGGLSSLVYLYLQNNALKTVGSLKALSTTLQHLNLACNLQFECASLELQGTQLLANSFCGQQVGDCSQ